MKINRVMPVRPQTGSVIITDMVLFGFALFCAYLIRFDFNFEEIRRYKFFQALPLVVVIQFMSFYFMKVYRGINRYAGLADLAKIGQAVILATLVILVVMLMSNRFEGYSRGVFILDAVLALLFAGAFRRC
jgi:FlaA1/EpsC-like NDP-sugar epimerase